LRRDVRTKFAVTARQSSHPPHRSIHQDLNQRKAFRDLFDRTQDLSVVVWWRDWHGVAPTLCAHPKNYLSAGWGGLSSNCKQTLECGFSIGSALKNPAGVGMGSQHKSHLQRMYHPLMNELIGKLRQKPPK
jgi:hypothetical protein